MNVEDIKARLGLIPHPEEGGYFVETYRNTEDTSGLPSRYDGPRCFGTAIYYLLTPETFSALHRLKSDEIFHFYMGDPIEMLHLYQDGHGEKAVLGVDLEAGQRPQVVVPQGCWQGARLKDGGTFALMGCTVAPGFEFKDYDHGDQDALTAAYPDFHEEISRLSQETAP